MASQILFVFLLLAIICRRPHQLNYLCSMYNPISTVLQKRVLSVRFGYPSHSSCIFHFCSLHPTSKKNDTISSLIVPIHPHLGSPPRKVSSFLSLISPIKSCGPLDIIGPSELWPASRSFRCHTEKQVMSPGLYYVSVPSVVVFSHRMTQ